MLLFKAASKQSAHVLGSVYSEAGEGCDVSYGDKCRSDLSCSAIGCDFYVCKSTLCIK